jgi:hypothetical protein
MPPSASAQNTVNSAIFLRPPRRHNQIVSASLRQARFAKATCIALNIMQNAYGRAPSQRSERWRES